MRLEKIELEIYRVYVDKTEKGDYNGRVILAHLHAGDYLKDVKYPKADPGFITQVSNKVKADMIQGMHNQIERAPFFVRKRIRNARYGDSILGVNINKNVIKITQERMAQLQRVIDEAKAKDDAFLGRLTQRVQEFGKNGREFFTQDRREG